MKVVRLVFVLGPPSTSSLMAKLYLEAMSLVSACILWTMSPPRRFGSIMGWPCGIVERNECRRGEKWLLKTRTETRSSRRCIGSVPESTYLPSSGSFSLQSGQQNSSAVVLLILWVIAALTMR
ncbi:hypothetical protein GGS20DRAFT_86006 [Poronia punctata]|nr:hypothetical protein GGS20DRAFT_86006 [Poronia punctata]